MGSVGAEIEREVLRQAGVALEGRVVTLWEISPTSEAIPVRSGVGEAAHQTTLDLNATLRQWGAPIIQGSRWVGCRLAGERWSVAPVRVRPAAPPPGGIERRSRERLVLELTGLGIGALSATVDGTKRLPPADALAELSRQPSVIAHEVGNPLAIALTNLDVSVDAIRDLDSMDPGVRGQLLEDLGNVARGVEQAADYLRSIQDRPFGGGPGRMARFDALPVVRSCVTLERPVARKDGIALKWQSSVDSVYLYGDSGALYQVITNLIRNAVDASRGTKSLVAVTVDRAGPTLLLAVSDLGVGIPAEHRERIFDSGFTTKRPGEGSGIGLAVVKEITQQMFGGTVRVESELGRGSTFTLELPIPPQRGVQTDA